MEERSFFFLPFFFEWATTQKEHVHREYFSDSFVAAAPRVCIEIPGRRAWGAHCHSLRLWLCDTWLVERAGGLRWTCKYQQTIFINSGRCRKWYSCCGSVGRTVTNGIEVERREVQFAMRLVARRVVVGGGWWWVEEILLHIQYWCLSVDMMKIGGVRWGAVS